MNPRVKAVLVAASVLSSAFPVIVTAASPAAAADWSLTWPVDGTIIGVQRDCRSRQTRCDDQHVGYDIDVGSDNHYAIDGEPIYASARGKVVARRGGDFVEGGRIVLVDHGSGTFTRYLHMKDFGVKDEDPVTRRTMIGPEGRSGYENCKNSTCRTHVHFEMRVNGTYAGGSTTVGQSVDLEPTAPIGSAGFVRSAVRDKKVRRGDPVPFVPQTSLPSVDFGIAADAVGMATGPNGDGYWYVTANGQVTALGDATHHGDASGVRLNKPIVGMDRTSSGNGYWLVAADGGVFTYGDAVFFGSTGSTALNQPIVGMKATATGNGYWLLARDGGVFTFGDAPFRGSVPERESVDDVVGMAKGGGANPGYWIVRATGKVHAFNVSHHGDVSGVTLNAPVVGIAENFQQSGYWLAAEDGGVFAFSASFYGSATSRPPPNEPVMGISRMASEGYRLVTALPGDVISFTPGEAGRYRAVGATNKPPVGFTDEGSVGRVRGWAYDPNEPTRSINVHVYIDGVGYDLGPTAVPRADVNAAHDITGNHGFDWTPPGQWSDGNPHTIEVYAVDSTGGTNTRLSVTSASGTNAPPDGRMDEASATRLTGWAFDPNDKGAPVRIKVTIDATVYDLGPTWIHRPEINAGLGLTGNHGFDWAIPAQWRDGWRHTVFVDAIDPHGGPSARISTSAFRLFADDWSWGDGSTWGVFKWDTSRNSATKVVNVSGKQGQLWVDGSDARAVAVMEPVADAEMALTYRFSDRNAQSSLRVGLRSSGDWPTTSGYRVDIQSDSSTVRIRRLVGGELTTIGSFTYTKDTSPQRLRVQVAGSGIKVKIWPASSSEPSGWSKQLTDTGVAGTGVLQLSHNWSSGKRSVYVDDLAVYDLNP
ncbi:MAG: M23 family metallopeptidase [Gaiellales bacterium]